MPERKGHFAPQNTFLDTIAKRFDGTHSNFLLGSAQKPGVYPIVYCSDGFCELTGFQRAQLMQRSCSCPFLYGEETSLDDRERIKDALAQKKELQGKMVLYKKNGEPFHCLLDIVPIKNDRKEVVMFLISHKSIPMPEQDNSMSGSYTSLASIRSFNATEISEDSPQMPNFKQLGHRRRSRAVLYTLSENLGPKKNKHGCFTSFTNRLLVQRNSSLPQYKVADKRPSRLTILHFGNAKTMWDWLVMAVTIYVISVVPYYAALQSVETVDENATSGGHSLETHGNTATLVFDILVEVIFIVDILLTFRTTYVNKSGCVVSDSRQIVINYFKTWFFIDFIAAIPIDTLSHLFDLGSIAQPLTMMKTLRLLRLLRLYHSIGRWTQYSAVLLLMLMLMFALLAHWLACIWFTIGWTEAQSQTVAGVGWLFELSKAINSPFYGNGTGGPDTNSAYITSLYFTLSSLTSVGFGNVSANTNKEKIFSICVMIIGALMHAVVFGNVTAIIQRIYAKRSQYDVKVKDMNDFIKVHRLSKTTKARMVDHFQNTWEADGGVNAKKVLRDFPRDIQIDVAMQIYKEVLNIPAFQRGPKGFSRLLSLHVQRRKVAPGDYVIYDGDPLVSVIFVCKGALEVFKNDCFIGMLGKGEILGADVGAPRGYPLISQADVKATYPCELECICIDGIKEAMDVYPEFSQVFTEDLRADFSFNLWQCAHDFHNFDDTRSTESSQNETSLLSTSKTNESLKSEHSVSFITDDLDYSQDEKKTESRFQSDDDLSNINETTSLFDDDCDSKVSIPPEKVYFNIKSRERGSNKLKSISPYNSLKNQEGSQSSNAILNRADFITCTYPTARSNLVKNKHPNHSDSPSKMNTLTTAGKQERSSKLSTFMNSLASVFSGKSSRNSEENLQIVSCDSSIETAARPSCFKKSLLSLQIPNSQVRSESVSSDVSGSTKRVTFSDDFNEQTSNSFRKSKRSLSIPGEEFKKTLSCSPEFNRKQRRHSDADLPSSAFSMNRTDETCTIYHANKAKTLDLEKSSISYEQSTYNCSNKEAEDLSQNEDLSSELSAIQSASSDGNRYKTSGENSSPLTWSPKPDVESPQRGNLRRKRRQRRKSNSPNSFSQLYRRRAKLDGDDLHDEPNGSDSDTPLKNDDGSLSSQLTICDCDRNGNLPDLYFLERFQQMNKKVYSLHSEIHKLVIDFKEFRRTGSPIKISKSDSELNCSNYSSNLTCQCPTPTNSHLQSCSSGITSATSGRSLKRQLNIGTNAQASPEGSLVLKGNHDFKTQAFELENDNVFLDTDASLPKCVVTSPAGETGDVVIDDEINTLEKGYNCKPGFEKMKYSFFQPCTNDSEKKNTTSVCSDLNRKDNVECKKENCYRLSNPVPFRDFRRFSSSSSLGSLSSFCSINPSQSRKQSLQEEDYFTPDGSPPENSSNVFIPIRNLTESPSFSDFEHECKNSRRLKRRGSGIRGNESGYISTSPTIQLRE